MNVGGTVNCSAIVVDTGDGGTTTIDDLSVSIGDGVSLFNGL